MLILFMRGKRQFSAQSVAKVFPPKLFWTKMSKQFIKERNPTSVLTVIEAFYEKIAIVIA